MENFNYIKHNIKVERDTSLTSTIKISWLMNKTSISTDLYSLSQIVTYTCHFICNYFRNSHLYFLYFNLKINKAMHTLV